mgnify:CR=1 FL=1
MKKIETIEQALELFEKYSISRGAAIDSGNSKLANRYYDKIRNLILFLREKKELSQLATFYYHPNAFVRLAAAVNLLPVFEKESLKIMKEVTKEKGIVSLEAEMTIREWKNGNLKNFYTL